MAKIKTIIIGTGGMARFHLKLMLEQKRTTDVVGFVETSETQRQAVEKLYGERKLKCPPFYNSTKELLKAQGTADAALIVTPHKFHFENARDCLTNKMHVLLEKPMVMNANEAKRLIAIRDTAKRHLVVAFPGSLSPAIHKAKQLITDGAIGNVTSVSGYAFQEWKKGTTNTWRQDPDMSGGGFLFDTGSHLINTTVDLIGEDVAQVTALLDNRKTPVEINSAISGQFKNGVMFSLGGAGESTDWGSHIAVFGDKGVLETGIWGERLLLKEKGKDEFKPVPYPKSKGVWEEFVKVVEGKLENPCPAEVGLRFAKLMDMIRDSAKSGKVVKA
ncbi:MAG: Gfo/Idh/MocA family protein [Trueperaceae bacterium]